MICVSTHGRAPTVSFKAVLAAADGGLYVPASLTPRPEEFWTALRGKSFQDVSAALAASLLGDEFAAGALDRLIRDALDFPVTLHRLDEGLQSVELFHGPTFAFKDFGARTLARVLALSERSATDGGASRVEGMTVACRHVRDTRQRVAQAFSVCAARGSSCCIPEGKVTAVQEAQFTTLGGNVYRGGDARRVRHCQRLAKAFADPALGARAIDRRIRSASSRLLPQMFYYAYASLQLPKSSRAVFPSAAATSGNLVAGVMAWKMRAPIERARGRDHDQRRGATVFRDRAMESAALGADLANAMDVSNPSNVERLQWLFDRDLRAMKACITTSVHTDDQIKDAIRTSSTASLRDRSAHRDRISRRESALGPRHPGTWHLGTTVLFGPRIPPSSGSGGTDHRTTGRAAARARRGAGSATSCADSCGPDAG
jgi:threonine synthase